MTPPPHTHIYTHTNKLKRRENVLKKQKFPDKIIFTGQKRGWSFARKETPQTQMDRPLQKNSFESGGVK